MNTSDLKPLYEVLKPYEEVLEGRLVEALNLADIYIYNELRDRLKTPYASIKTPLHDPVKFLERTHMSENIVKIVLRVFGGIAGMTSVYLDDYGKKTEIVNTRVFVIPSLLGGGKTHLLTTLYHIALLYNMYGVSVTRYIKTGDKYFLHGLHRIFDLLSSRGEKIYIVAHVGDISILSPTPENPVVIDDVEIHTPWGLLALLIGEYDAIRKYDQSHTPPPEDVLRKILLGKRVLILLDESPEYLTNAKSLSTRYPGYDEAYTSFIRNLAQAVSAIEGAVLVVSIPAEYREGSFTPSRQHPEYVMTILDMLRRVQIDIVPPLEIKKDIVEVFKKRLFKNINDNTVKAYLEKLVHEIREKTVKDPELGKSIKALYGDLVDFEHLVRKTYPFHPYFIELLTKIGIKVPSLGMTRGLLAFMARLTRYLYNKKINVALIVPWVVPLDEPDYRAVLTSDLLTRNDLQNIYESDVKKHVAEASSLILFDTSDRESIVKFLKACIVKTLWLTTIPGEGRRTADALDVYPDTDILVAIVYDPLTYKQVFAADVVNVLKQLIDESTYLVIDEAHNKVFYAIMPDITRLIRERYREISGEEALTILEQYTRDLRRGEKFNEVKTIHLSMLREVEDIVDSVLSRDTEPKLFIYLALRDPSDRLPDIVLRRNNVALLLPSYSDDPRRYGLTITSRIRNIAGDMPSNMREHLIQLLRVLGAVRRLRGEREYLVGIVGEDMISHIMTLLKRIEEDVSRQLTNLILTMLNQIYLGKKKRRERIDIRPMGSESIDLSRIASAVENYLERIGIRFEWTWEDLYLATREWSELWSIDGSLKKPIKIIDLWRQLLESPGIEPHITGFNDLLQAIIEGYENGRIAFKYGTEILWIRSPVTPSEAEQLVKTRVAKGIKLLDWERQVKLLLNRHRINVRELEIIDPKQIIRDFIEDIRKKARVKPGEKIIRKLIVYTGEKTEDFESFIARARDEYELVELLSTYPVALVEEAPETYFTIKINTVNGTPYTREPIHIRFDEEGSLKITGRVESDYYPYSINIEIWAEELSSGKKKLVGEKLLEKPMDFEFETIIDKPGEYLVLVRAIGNDPKQYVHPEIPVARVVVSGVKCVNIEYCGEDIRELMEKSETVSSITISLHGTLKRYMYDAIYRLLQSTAFKQSSISGKVSIKSEEETITIDLNNVKAPRVAQLINILRTLSTTTYSVADIDLSIEGVMVEKLFQDNVILKTLTDTVSGLADLTCIEAIECRRIGND